MLSRERGGHEVDPLRNDYESAEALYAGVIVILGVVISQQFLRIVKHGGGDINSVFHHGNGQLF